MWISTYQDPENRRFEIEHDKSVGYYVYAYNAKGFNFYDGLQDTLEFAKEEALEEFSVPVDSWVEFPTRSFQISE